MKYVKYFENWNAERRSFFRCIEKFSGRLVNENLKSINSSNQNQFKNNKYNAFNK
jgi:hypothetical protein